MIVRNPFVNTECADSHNGMYVLRTRSYVYTAKIFPDTVRKQIDKLEPRTPSSFHSFSLDSPEVKCKMIKDPASQLSLPAQKTKLEEEIYAKDKKNFSSSKKEVKRG